MKKIALLMTICMLAWGTLTGCQREQAPTTQEPTSSTVQTSSGVSEEDPVVICIEDAFEQDAYELENYLLAKGVETDYEFLVLPDNQEKREPELTRLRTEIMAGEGPDAFILNATIPGTVTDSGDVLESLFPNVEKSMYSHLFLDLEDMVQQSEIVDLESCNQTVMNVGVTGDGRFLLPLTYTFSMVAVDKSALADPDYTFSTLDELLQSDQEALKEQFAYRTFNLFPNCLGVLADYEGQNLLVTADSLQKAIEQSNALSALQNEDYSDSPEVYRAGYSGDGLRSLINTETVYTFFPIPNPEGGVTAAVTFYAAINRNAAHPQEAFDFIELLYSEELASTQGFEVNGRHYGSIFHYGYSGGLGAAVPVKDEVFFQYLEESGIQPDTMASVRAAVARIDSAKVYSDLDQDIYELYETWHFSYGQLDTPLEELVEQTISSMEMTLAE